MAILKNAGIVIAGLLGFVCVSMLVSGQRPLTAKTDHRYYDPVPELVDNPANDSLMSVSPQEQAKLLGGMAGKQCKGQTAFYMGIGKSGFSKAKAFWSVRCADEKSYMIEVDPDGHGSVLECSFLKAMNAGACFTKL